MAILTRGAGRRPLLAPILMATLAVQGLGQVDEYQLKAAFLFNFAKFVSWPEGAFKSADEPIGICVLGQNPFGDKLERTVAGKTVNGRTIAVRRIAEIAREGPCHILFVGLSERKQFRTKVENLAGTGVLTVGDWCGFAGEGGAIAFKMDAGRVRLQIDAAAAQRQSVQISSKLLSIAEIVRKTP